MAVAPVDSGVGGSCKRVKKLFRHVPTLIKVRATLMHNCNQTWTMPSTARMAISGPDNRLPPPKPKTGFDPSWITFLRYSNVSKKTRVLKYW